MSHNVRLTQPCSKVGTPVVGSGPVHASARGRQRDCAHRHRAGKGLSRPSRHPLPILVTRLLYRPPTGKHKEATEEHGTAAHRLSSDSRRRVESPAVMKRQTFSDVQLPPSWKLAICPIPPPNGWDSQAHRGRTEHCFSLTARTPRQGRHGQPTHNSRSDSRSSVFGADAHSADRCRVRTGDRGTLTLVCAAGPALTGTCLVRIRAPYNDTRGRATMDATVGRHRGGTPPWTPTVGGRHRGRGRHRGHPPSVALRPTTTGVR